MLLIQFFILVSFVVILIISYWCFRRYQKTQLIKKLYLLPLKPEYLELLKRHVPLSNSLPKELESVYHGHINYFLATKIFVGRGGFEVDDRVRLAIAGNACLLVLKRAAPIFSGFKTIIVYPATYQAANISNNAGVIESRLQHRGGESWYRGPIVLSWSDVEFGSIHSNDAHNVVIHEFAHKLDEENKIMDGLPVLREHDHYKEWAEVLTKEYEAFLVRVDKNKNKVIDEYGSVSAVEFFAAITESFFEKPQMMKRKLPDLYQQLSQYFGVDPSQWNKTDRS